MKQVRETNAFKSISAYYIYNPKTGQRAQVEAHWSNGGVCRVDVWQFDGAGLVHQGRAGGYGYDKFAAALSGAVIYGVKIFDHCGQDEVSKKLLAEYMQASYKSDNNEDMAKLTEKYKNKLAKIGASFANFSTDGHRYTSVYYKSGLERLESFGFKVIQVV